MKIDPSKFLTPSAVAERIEAALRFRRPFSLVRIGDGEALAMAQDSVLSLEEVQQQKFLRYAGVSIPDLKVRDELLAMIVKADIVGLPDRWDLPYFSPLVSKILTHYRIQLGNVCNCCINYQLHQAGLLFPLFKNRRLLLIGRRSRELAPVLKEYYGLSAIGKILIDNYRQVPSAMNQCGNNSFDIAFVAAGIPAVTLCVKIASRFGKVALDLGHLADRIIEEYL
jgi:hypothetical protein